MKGIVLFLLLASVTAVASATGPASAAYTPAASAVLSELSRRSAVPDAELKGLLSDCNAS
jgi:hypothetical protein